MENSVQNRSNLSSVLLVVFLVTTLLLGGFIVYDKFLKKEESVECPKCEEKECPKEECPKCEECNCPTCSNNGDKINSLKEIKLTTTNQTVKVGSKTLKIKKGSTNDDYHNVYIDDIPIVYSDNTRISVDNAYVTDKFIFFTTEVQDGKMITYVLGEKVKITPNNNDYRMDSFKIIDGYLHASGHMFCGDFGDCSDEDLLIKYIDNTLIVTLAK